MRVKGTKQLGSFKRGINLYVPKRNISQPAEQIIWKVAIFGAGTASSNGEYVWDGSQVSEDGTKIYNAQSGNSVYFYSVSGETYSNSWVIDDIGASTITYYSQDLISWYPIEGSGTSPAPSSALSYAQNSFISSLTLIGAGTISSNGTYTRNVGGFESFYKASSSNYIFSEDPSPEDNSWIVFDATTTQDTYLSDMGFLNWQVYDGLPDAPSVSAVVYSA